MRKSVALCIVIVVAALASIFLYLFKSTLYSVANSLYLMPRAETYTELYMNDYANFSGKLPLEIHPGTKINFSFTLHNVEGRDAAYPYVVYVVNDWMGTTTIDSKTISLSSGEVRSINESYIFPQSEKQAEVFVVLTNLHQTLHFFVPAKD